MTTLKARNLALKDVRKLLGFQPKYNGSFASKLSLEPITEAEQQELANIQDEFRNYIAESKVLEGQVRLISVAPLLRLAGYNRHPIKLNVEEDIASIYIEDEDTTITGRLDIVAVNKERANDSDTFLWIPIVETKNSDGAPKLGLPQLLIYAFKSLEHQKAIWGLTTNGDLYQFVYICQGNPPTYEYMPILSLLESDRAIQLLQVLKAVRQVGAIATENSSFLIG